MKTKSLQDFITKMRSCIDAKEYDIERDGVKKHCICTHGSSIWYLMMCRTFGLDNISGEYHTYHKSAISPDGSFEFEYVEGDCILTYKVD